MEATVIRIVHCCEATVNTQIVTLNSPWWESKMLNCLYDDCTVRITCPEPLNKR